MGKKRIYPRNNASQFRQNEKRVLKRYEVNEQGFFGHRQKGAGFSIRTIATDDPGKVANWFWTQLGRGGETVLMKNGKGTMKVFRGGSLVAYRTVSSDGSPVIEIKSANRATRLAPYQKIHFSKRGTK